MLYIIFVPLWILVYLKLTNISQNIKRNLFSAVHSIICIILCYCDYDLAIFYWSISYYVYDLIIQVIATKLFNIPSLAMIFHHIISIYTLTFLRNSEKEMNDLFVLTFMLLEISNFPIYITYHWKQIYGKKLETKLAKYIMKILLLSEIISFFVIRLTYIPYIIILNYHIISIEIIIITILLYTLSTLWWLSMIKQFKK